MAGSGTAPHAAGIARLMPFTALRRGRHFSGLLAFPTPAGLVLPALLFGPAAPGEVFGVCRPSVLPRRARRAASVPVGVLQPVLEDRRLVARAVEL